MSAYSSAPSSQQKDSAGQRIRQKAAQEFHLLTERLSAFGEKAKRVLKGENRHQGQYTNLNESLLSEEDMSTEQQQRNGDSMPDSKVRRRLSRVAQELQD